MQLVRSVAWQGLSLTIFLLMLSSVAQAQSISGVVTDEQGGALPGVTVTIENLDTGATRTVVTSSRGRYETPGMPPGTYAVEGMLSGFSSAIRRGVTVTVGQDIVVDLTLSVGEVTDEIVVVGGAPLVNTSSATVSGLIDERAMRDLPLVSRSWDQLTTLQPGAAVFRAVDTGSSSQGFGQKFTVSGQRPTSNTFYQDGVELGGAQRITGLPGSAAGVNLGVEAIREFRVLTSTYSPEYGKKAGGAIISVTKSGTNQVHGSLFEFHRNEALDAPNFFAVGEKDPFERNNFGASLGGPILRDQTFFFVNYEGLREDLARPQSVLVPNQQVRRGFLPGADGQLQFVGVAPEVRPFLALWPLPNGRDFGDGTAAYEFAPTRETGEDYFLGKIDHQFSDTDSVFASYNISDAALANPLDNPLFFEETGTREQRLSTEYKRIMSSALLNTLRFGWHRSYHDVNSRSSEDLGILEITPGAGLANLFVEGLASGGPGTQGSTYGLRSSFQVSDHLSYIRDRHSFEVGGVLQRIHIDEDPTDRKNGEWEFDGLRELLLGDFRAFTGAFPIGATGVMNIGLPLDIEYVKNWRQTYGALYVRDRFRWRPNLTLDLGLRYEVLTSPTEVNGRVSNMPYTRNPPFNYIMDTDPVIGKKAYSTNWDKGLAPRLGIVWDPFSKGKTSVKAGYGVFYDQVESEFRFFTHINPPFAPRAQTSAPGSFPIPWAVLDVGELETVGRSIDPELDVPAIQHFNVGIEQQVGGAAMVSVAYIGSRGSHLLDVVESNLNVPVLVDDELFWPENASLANPLLGQWDILLSEASNGYDALQTEFQTRFAGDGPLGRLRSKVGYTFSKATDTMSGLQSSAASNTRGKHLDPFDLERDRGLSAYHMAHRLTVNFTYDLQGLPFHGIVGALSNNWQVSGIWIALSGLPVNLQNGTRRSRNGQNTNVERPDLIAGGDDDPVLGGYERYFDPSQFVLPSAGFHGNVGRNTLSGPGLSTFDLALSRYVPLTTISDDFNIQIRLEIFNLFNQTNFGLPDSSIFNSDGTVRGSVGRITETSTPARQMQLGLKIVF